MNTPGEIGFWRGEIDNLKEEVQNLIDENAMVQQALSDADIAGKNAVLEIERLTRIIDALSSKEQDHEQEIERLKADGEPSNEQTIGMFNAKLTEVESQLTAANAEIKAHLNDFDTEHHKCYLLLRKVEKLRHLVSTTLLHHENCSYPDGGCDCWVGRLLQEMSSIALADTEEK